MGCSSSARPERWLITRELPPAAAIVPVDYVCTKVDRGSNRNGSDSAEPLEINTNTPQTGYSQQTLRYDGMKVRALTACCRPNYVHLMHGLSVTVYMLLACTELSLPVPVPGCASCHHRVLAWRLLCFICCAGAPSVLARLTGGTTCYWCLAYTTQLADGWPSRWWFLPRWPLMGRIFT